MMPAELICTSHSPLTNIPGLVGADVEARLEAGLTSLRSHIKSFGPDLIVQFGNDHNSGLSLGLMPPFMVGLRARGLGDFDTSAGEILIAEEVGRELVQHLHHTQVDVATSYDLILDHGFVWALDHLIGGIDHIPVIPIFTNCGGDLRPPVDRSLSLGDSVGHFLAARYPNRRVLILGSGGLSHDPPLPDFKSSPPEVQARMIEGTIWTAESLVARSERVADAGRQHGRGEGNLRPLNPDWDEWILDRLIAGDLETIAGLGDAEIIREAGRGGSEIRNWLSAFAAMRAYGEGLSAERIYYEPIPSWIVGFAMARAHAQPIAA